MFKGLKNFVKENKDELLIASSLIVGAMVSFTLVEHYFNSTDELVEVATKKLSEVPTYDTFEAIEFIHDETGFDRELIGQVIDADVKYKMHIGIIQVEEF